MSRPWIAFWILLFTLPLSAQELEVVPESIRIEGPFSRQQILVSERTMVAVRDLVDGAEIDQIQLKGVQRPIRIYEIREKGGAG